MKWMYLLPLLLTAVLCEKKLNVREIRRDHQRVENRGKKSSTSEELRADESKYSVKAEVSQQYYAPTAAATASTATVASAPTGGAGVASQELGNQVGDYAELQSYESFKYAQGNQQQDYSQENDDSSAYLQQSQHLTNAAEQQQHQQQQQHIPQQYYIQEGRSHSQNVYDVPHQQQQQQQHQPQQQQQQQLYQQEVLVGNQLQSVQQKVAAQKYTDGSDDKGIYYINIPMSQLLAYYQNYGIVQSRSKNAEQQVPIPLYTPALTQNQVYAPAKVTYQPKLQYVSAYPKHTQAIIAKPSPPTTVLHAAPAATIATPVHQVPAASHQQYTAPVELLAAPTYATAYQPRYQYQYVTVQQPQLQQYAHQYQHQPQQQQQQIIYENAQNSYQADAYNEPATDYEQDNFLYEQQQQYQPQPKQQQYYVPTAVAEQLTSQLLHQTNLQNSIENAHPQSIKQEQLESLHTEFIPPQYQAQQFRASQEITHLIPVSNEHEGFPSKSTYSSASHSSQPKTLLDTYVPSHVIAAQDAQRYRERPIKLESGFLPSKINFIGYKKRKTE